MTQQRQPGGWGYIEQQARAECDARRARVLAHADLAARLTEPPLSYTQPQQWTGYVPPRTWGERLNTSPQRAALVEICTEAMCRDGDQAVDEGAV